MSFIRILTPAYYYYYSHGPDVSARQHDVLATLVATWGDGNVMGTGGTLLSHTSTTGSSSQMEMWMGVWSHVVHSSSSNWKEL
eukprot:scaffold421330_cov55-Attheya_sp.AAC.2